MGYRAYYVVKSHKDEETHEKDKSNEPNRATNSHEYHHAGGEDKTHKWDRSTNSHEDRHKLLPYEKAANALMSAKGYLDYVEVHGYHFTDALAEHVSRMMVNGNGKEHSWRAKDVKSSFDLMGLPIPDGVTLGDVTYTANMFYADLHPKAFPTEESCLVGAYLIAQDVDGYDGMVFCRWTSDAIGKGIEIDWDKFI